MTTGQITNKRTKQVFSNKEVPHIWASQSQHSARNSQGSVFFEGKTIFSYGKHFPIATIEGDTVLFTTRKYSNTTAKHISRVRQAISHQTIIYCKDVPVPYWNNNKPVYEQSFTLEHERNIKYWKDQLTEIFTQLGNKRNRDITSRVNSLSNTIHELNAYCNYFSLPIKDKELKALIKLAESPDLIEKARKAKELQDANDLAKMQTAAKAYDKYIALWRAYDSEAMTNMTDKQKELVNYYANKSESFTRLRFNEDAKRVETSKGVEIPVAIAHKAYKAIKDCINCTGIAVPVLQYSITEANTEYIKAGCHTIPQSDVKYIANLLNW